MKVFKQMLSIGVLFLVFGCQDNYNPITPNRTETLEIDARLNQDFNGYYHLILNRYIQTTHRISAQTNHIGNFPSGRPDVVNVFWEVYDMAGNHKIWIYIVAGKQFEVDIVNHFSITGSEGFATALIGPEPWMVGDTVRVIATYDSQYTVDRFVDDIYIIFD